MFFRQLGINAVGWIIGSIIGSIAAAIIFKDDNK